MRLLLTRPQHDSESLLPLLERGGHSSLIAPLMEIAFKSLPSGALDDVKGLLFTSANGVSALVAAAPDMERSLPAYCVGNATAKTARAAGFTDLRIAGGDVDLLARRVLDDPDRGVLLHPAGTKLAGDLGQALSEAGRSYRRAVVYEAVAATALTDEADYALIHGEIDGVLLFSPRTATIFARVTEAPDLRARLSKVTAFCLSTNVASALDGVGFKAKQIAREPTTDALLELLN